MYYDEELIALETALDDLIDNPAPMTDNSKNLGLICQIVSSSIGAHPKSKARDAKTSSAKRAFCYLAIKSKYHPKEVGDFIGIDRVTAMYHHSEMLKEMEFVRKIKEIENGI